MIRHGSNLKDFIRQFQINTTLALIAVANKLVKQPFALTSKSELYAKDFAL